MDDEVTCEDSKRDIKMTIDISFVDKPLQALLKAGNDHPNSDIDFSVAYISASGISWLQPLLKKANRKRAVVGLCTINRVNALLELKDLGVEVYLYIAELKRVFHPKIYYGATNTQAWAMVGSSNLTHNGLVLSVERNLLITGQRHIEPFVSLETQLATFRDQSYLFNRDIEKILLEIERKMIKKISEEEYQGKLIDAGIKPKLSTASIIPTEIQHVALEKLKNFTLTTPLVHAYQMLLLLTILLRADEKGFLFVEEAIDCFLAFYNLRDSAGLRREVSTGSKRAVVENRRVTRTKMRQMLKESPLPRFERNGLLDLSEDDQHFMVNPALTATLTPLLKQELRSIAIQRIAEHFGEDKDIIEAIVAKAIG